MNRRSRIALVVALAAVTLLAFRVSWGALRDVATAIGADRQAAVIYPVVVDGLMALALVAALVLTGAARRLALGVLGGYTLASLVLNYVHGLSPALHSPDGPVPLPWSLVLLASALPVGAIFFGSDLVARVLRAGTGTPAGPAVPEAAPVPARAVVDRVRPYPVVVPAGVRTLPIVSRTPVPALLPAPAVPAVPEVAQLTVDGAEVPYPAAPDPLAADRPTRTRRTRVAAADGPRTRRVSAPVDRAEGVPARTMADPDLIAEARRDFADVVSTGGTPSVRALRTRYGIGQARAQRIRDAIEMQQLAA